MSDSSSRVRLTAGRVAAFACPHGKSQAFLWDTEAPSLMLRATPSGRKTYAFEARLKGATIRVSIGTAADWSLDQARKRAAELKQLVDSGEDPREIAKAKAAERASLHARTAVEATTVGSLWQTYLTEGRPKRRDSWKPRYLHDLTRMASAGGAKKARGDGVTRPGPLFPLLCIRLTDITEDSLKAWHDKEAKRSKHQAARALMMFRGFLRWCATRPEYRGLVNPDVGKAPALLQSLPSTKRRTDALESAQVSGWWVGVEQLPNRTASAYLRALLLTGARREEMAALRWDDVDLRWKKLTLADKVDATRTIPLTPYLGQLLTSIPRFKQEDGTLSPYVFASAGKQGRITDVRSSHAKALRSAGIEGLTFHGLRRSFSLLGEAAGAPAGAIAQIMGHKPSATAEGYRPRSVDALRPFLAQIEAHVLALAGVQFNAQEGPEKLRLVTSA